MGQLVQGVISDTGSFLGFAGFFLLLEMFGDDFINHSGFLLEFEDVMSELNKNEVKLL